MNEEARNELVHASLIFIRALGNVYDTETAMNMWQTISDTVDPELKGLTFAAMLQGYVGGDVVLTGLHPNANAVSVIKAIRTYDKRSPGLKEAKDLYDALRYNNTPARVEVTYQIAEKARKEFRNLGCVVV